MHFLTKYFSILSDVPASIEVTVVVLLDQSTAFDTFDHDTLKAAERLNSVLVANALKGFHFFLSDNSKWESSADVIQVI